MAGADEFARRIDYLSDQVGTGNIVAGCDVDQPYAQNQHQNLTFRHTFGGAHYLGGPLAENRELLVARLAQSIIDESGSHVTREMIEIAEKMAGYVVDNAPRDPDIGDVLANSGSPWVTDNGREIYRRPPVAQRDYDHD
jgi:hypothetical protein